MPVRLLLVTLAAGLIALALFFGLPGLGGEGVASEREAYETFLNEHPYANRTPITRDELKAIPKKDRPDLAAEQQFLLTMDPDTRTIPIERLYEANRIATSLKRGAGSSLVIEEWEERGPTNVGGRTRALLFDPNDAEGKKFWAGGVAGGLWYTHDITEPDSVWYPVDDFWANLAVSSIDYDPANTQVFYVGTGEGWFNVDAVRGGGLFKTEDGGETWTQLESTTGSEFQYVQKVAVHPVTSDVYAGTREGGLRRSQDGGQTWEMVLGSGNGATSRVADVEIDSEGRIYAAFGIFSTDGIYASDTGDVGTWTKISSNPGFPASGFQRIEMTIAPSNENVLYAVTQATNSGAGGIYRSDDAGATWTTVALPTNADPGIGSDFTRGQAWYDLSIAVLPDDPDHLFVGGIDLHKSTNGGTSWSQVSHWYGGFGFPEVHADQHAIAFRPGSPTEAVFSHDGGITYTANADAAQPTWVNRNYGYNVTQFYAGAIHPGEDSNVMLAGAQDNGTQRYSQPGASTTQEVYGGDGAYTFIDQDQPGLAIASYVYNRYYRSGNGGVTFPVTLLNENSGSFINPADYDDREDILYTNRSGANFYRVTGILGSPSATQIPISMGTAATHLRVSPYAPEGTSTVFLGTGAGRIFKVSNAQAENLNDIEIEELNTPWPAMAISSIEIGTSENQLLVTSSSYSRVSVWETLDGGQTWANREGNLPDIPVRWGLYHPDVPGVALVATEAGVWETTDLGSPTPTWTPSPGFPTVSTYMLQLRASDNMVMAATHGRGVYTARFRADVVSSEDAATTPQAHALSAAYPNPFADRATFTLRLDDAQRVRVELYDVRGRQVALIHDGPLAASEHRFEIDGAGLAAGTYLYVASGERFRDEGRVTLVR